MKKTSDLLKTNIALVDLSIAVLDARVPFSSLNPLVEEIISQKPVVYLLNKSDLADAQQTALWVEYFKKKKNAIVMTSTATQASEAKRVTATCYSLCPEAKTGRRGVRVLITGIPNAGKSTLINTLCGESKAKTGDRPAVTKTLQKILTPEGLDLYDTPGILWHKFENQTTAYRLAATGAIREEILNLPDIALYAIEFFQHNYIEEMEKRFQLTDTNEKEPIEVLEQVGRRRGCIAKGGALDWEKAAAIFLREMRAGKICPVTFDRFQELSQLEEQKEAADGV